MTDNVITDENGNEYKQREISIEKNESQKEKPRRRMKMFPVINLTKRKIFLHDGRTILPNSDGFCTKADLDLPIVKQCCRQTAVY